MTTELDLKSISRTVAARVHIAPGETKKKTRIKKMNQKEKELAKIFAKKVIELERRGDF